jgi:hypothetical protein
LTNVNGLGVWLRNRLNLSHISGTAIRVRLGTSRGFREFTGGCLDGHDKIIENGNAIDQVLGKVGKCPLMRNASINRETAQEGNSSRLQVVVEDAMHILDERLEEVSIAVEFTSDKLHIEEIGPIRDIFP